MQEQGPVSDNYKGNVTEGSTQIIYPEPATFQTGNAVQFQGGVMDTVKKFPDLRDT